MSELDELKPKFEEISRSIVRLENELQRLKAAQESLGAQIGAASASPAASSHPLATAAPTPVPFKPPSLPFEARISTAIAGVKESLVRNGVEDWVGEKLFNYIGVLLLVLGGAFFLIFQATRSGPMGRIVIGASSSLVLIIGGNVLRRKKAFNAIAMTIVGGGWTLLYFTAYAAHYLKASMVIESTVLESVLLLGVALSMVAQGEFLNSVKFQNFTLALSYGVFLIAPRDPALFAVLFVLAAVGTFLTVRRESPALFAINVIGFNVNYIPVLGQVLHSFAELEVQSPDIAKAAVTGIILTTLPWLVAGYLLFVLTTMVEKAKKIFNEQLADAALSFAVILFSCLVVVEIHNLFHKISFVRTAASSAFLTAVGWLLWKKSPRHLSIQYVQPILATGTLMAGVLSIDSPLQRLLATAGSTILLSSFGFLIANPIWRACGLSFAVLLPYAFVSSYQSGEHAKTAGVVALFAGLAAGVSRFYSTMEAEALGVWEKGGADIWCRVAGAAVLASLWAILDPSAFVLCVMLLAFVGELSREKLPPALERDLGWLQVAAGLYFLAIDFGANQKLLGLVSPRVLVALSTIAVLLSLSLFAEDATLMTFTDGRKDLVVQKRGLLGWLATAAMAVSVFQEFSPRVRLLIWASSALAFLWLGRTSGNRSHKFQSYALVLLTAFDGILTYLQQPRILLDPLTRFTGVSYWVSSLALLGAFAIPDKEPGRSRGWNDRFLFSAVCQTMLIIFFAKEIQGLYLTLAMSLQGIVFLVVGLSLRSSPLRVPALMTLGVCIGKALLYDASKLDIRFRILSYMVLGAILVLTSILYVRRTKGAKTAP